MMKQHILKHVINTLALTSKQTNRLSHTNLHTHTHTLIHSYIFVSLIKKKIHFKLLRDITQKYFIGDLVSNIRARTSTSSSSVLFS